MTAPFRLLDPARPSSAFGTAEFRSRCAFAVMAKAPVPGKVKTRLSPPLTPEQAALLNTHFLRDTLASLNDAARECSADCVLSYTPVGEEEAFRGIAPPSTLLLPQRGDGFGERLLATAADLLACGFSAVCLIDSDSPTVPTAEWIRAAQTLLAKPETIVLGRSDDGGYYLLGLAAPHAHLFENISWSTDAVAAQTAERAAALGLPLTELTTWFDVDDRTSLARLRRELAAEGGPGYPALHTRLFLAQLAISESEDEPQPEAAAAAAVLGASHGHR